MNPPPCNPPAPARGGATASGMTPYRVASLLRPVLRSALGAGIIIRGAPNTNSELVIHAAPVAQLDRALASEAKGRGSESRRARHLIFTLHEIRRAVRKVKAGERNIRMLYAAPARGRSGGRRRRKNRANPRFSCCIVQPRSV